jgi:hypothetical protein
MDELSCGSAELTGSAAAWHASGGRRRTVICEPVRILTSEESRPQGGEPVVRYCLANAEPKEPTNDSCRRRAESVRNAGPVVDNERRA